MVRMDPGFLRVWQKKTRRSDRAPTHTGRIRLPVCPNCGHCADHEYWVNGWVGGAQGNRYVTMSVGDPVVANYEERGVRRYRTPRE